MRRAFVGVPPVVRNVGEILQKVRIPFSSVGRGRGAEAGVNDVLAHAPAPLEIAVIDGV
jgi:hypothetical protein